MRISIVTISYNQAQFLRDCIESVLGQGHEDVEYIVVDAGSTDGSREIIESYGERIIKVFEADDGPADGLNKGFSHATGEVFGFLNSDDEFLPGALTCIAQAFKARPGVDVISGCGYFIDAAGRRAGRVASSKFTPWLYAYGAIAVFQQGTFFRAAPFGQVGGFNAANRTCWDGELFLEMAMNGARFAAIGDALALFRVHDGSITGTGRLNKEYRKECDRLFERVTGRERSGGDRVLERIGPLIKYTFDPTYILRRLAPRSVRPRHEQV